MSFCQVRLLTEKLRSLGYGPVVSIEAFRSPNFLLVADILAWLVLCYDPNAPVPLSVSNEDERVVFVTTIAQYLATSAQIKLNPLKIYKADGSAVREILKLIDLFTAAQSTLLDDNSKSPKRHSSSALIKKPAGASIGTASIYGGIDSKTATAKAARDLTVELTSRGALLYDLLATESHHRELRSSALSKAIDLPNIKTAAENALASTRKEVQSLTQMVATMDTDKQALVSKTEKKRSDLDRRSKRLKSLQGVRPAYMDEFERIEAELKIVYSSYVCSVRNLAFLENQVEETDRMEQTESEETERSLKRLQEKVQQEELDMLRGQVDGSESDEESSYGFALDELDDSLSSSLRKKSALFRHRAYGTSTKSQDSSDASFDDDMSLHNGVRQSSPLAVHGKGLTYTGGTQRFGMDDDSDGSQARVQRTHARLSSTKFRSRRGNEPSRIAEEFDEDSDEDSELDDDAPGTLRRQHSSTRDVLHNVGLRLDQDSRTSRDIGSDDDF